MDHRILLSHGDLRCCWGSIHHFLLGRGEIFDKSNVATFPQTFYTERVKDTIIVLATAPAGLGHLRVTDALYHGLPEGTRALILGSQDKSLKLFHNFVSIHPFTRLVFEWCQYGWREDVFTTIYRAWLRSHTRILEEQLLTILAQPFDSAQDRHPEPPKTLPAGRQVILAIATHMGLAQQFGAIKDSFSKKYNVRMIVVVVVTDDAPLKIWAAGGADLIFVPSQRTKKRLEAYHKQQRFAPADYIVVPYMVHPGLGKPLSKEAYEDRKDQLDPSGKSTINIAIPVSGAAVQMDFFERYMDALEEQLSRARFHIVSKDMLSTRRFLSRVRTKATVSVFSSASDREVVDRYERLYRQHTIALELTKPSEQAFKALVDPTKRGGSILLLTDPVGRQEWDNLNFLERHGLLGNIRSLRKEEARRWRALRLPSDPVAAANFTLWCLHHGIFSAMADFRGFRHHPELASNGVNIFWKQVGEYLAI